MHELFRMKIAAKRQMTVPQRLLSVLGLSEGDELQIEVADGQIVGTHACKAVPTALLSDELLSKIKKREAELIEGKGRNLLEVLPEAAAEPAPVNWKKVMVSQPSHTQAMHVGRKPKRQKSAAAQYEEASQAE